MNEDTIINVLIEKISDLESEYLIEKNLGETKNSKKNIVNSIIEIIDEVIYEAEKN